jgi:dihydroorotase
MVDGTQGNLFYDTIIHGGRVIDPANGFDGQFDVAILDGKIARIEAGIDPALGHERVDASGQIVTPGLVDLHTHIYWGVTYWGIEADPVAAKTGVTTWLDVGSSGSYTFPGFRRYVVEQTRARVFALLHVSSIGLVAPTWEVSNLDYCDIDLAESIVNENRDLILGIKIRVDRNTTRGTGIRPLELARELADRVNLPLMVHIGWGPPTLDEVVHLLRAGDILTHCFTGGDHRIVDEGGKVRANVRELHDRGLILDIGHGTGSFNYEVSEAALHDGVVPDVISSDIHQTARQGPAFDLPTTLSKFLNLGMSLPDVIERATSKPAAAMHRTDLGTLAVGSVADVALFRVEEGEFRFFDSQMNERGGTLRLMNTLTLVDGEALPRVPERPMHSWAKLPEHQQPIKERAQYDW